MQTKRVRTAGANNNGWREIAVETHRKAIEGRYKTKHQVTIELTAPYTDTITIESSEPFTDVELFAKEMLIAAEYRHRARCKQLIFNNREVLRNTIVPLWLEREAFTARYKAGVESRRKESKRKLCAGIRDLKTHNNLIRSLKNATDDEDYTETLNDYTQRIKRELQKIEAPKDFHMSRYDLNELFNRGWWENFLQINEYHDKHRRNVVGEVRQDLERFNRMYNIEPYTPDVNQMLENYDTITTAGFSDIILAAMLKHGDEICAVMAIDNEQGRRALRHLAGERELARILPKRIYNAITRNEIPEMQDIALNTETVTEMIIIE